MKVSIARWLAWVAVAVVTLTACSGGQSSTGQKTRGGVARYAELPSAPPNYIFPLTSLDFFSVNTINQFQVMLYRPLYWFSKNGQVALNPDLSLADPPQFSADGKTVTIKLKGWKWSDGQPVTSRDLEFWQNLVKANKDNWAAYSPGAYPDNIVGASYPDSQTAVFTLDKAYGSYFFTYNELSQITPMPQHVWDRTSDASPVGDYDRSEGGAADVYKYLDGQAKTLGTYNTNPLWKVVDGAWRMKQFRTDGFVSLVPNPGYSGPVKPSLAEVDELPFTSDTAEFNVLRQGGVDYGYLPTQDLNQKNYLSQHGYTFDPWISWSINYIPMNMTNPTSGPIFSQLYFRQAVQHLVDQKGVISNILKGYGNPTYGPVPIRPPSKFVDSYERSNPYPFDASAAVKLLKDNGWNIVPDGVSTCANPGTGQGQCGQGVAAGAKASFNLIYASGTLIVSQQAQVLKSDLAKAGIQINLSQAPFNTVISTATPCNPGEACNWDIAFWGGGWVYAPDYYPTGDELWSTGAGSNSNGYSSQTNDANTDATLTSNDVKPLNTYEDFLAKDLPVIWFPNNDYQLSEVKSSLKGAFPQDALLTIEPENWYFTK